MLQNLVPPEGLNAPEPAALALIHAQHPNLWLRWRLQGRSKKGKRSSKRASRKKTTLTYHKWLQVCLSVTRFRAQTSTLLTAQQLRVMV